MACALGVALALACTHALPSVRTTRVATSRARLATSAVCASKKRLPLSALKPDEYFKYLQAGDDRTEEDQSPPSDVDEPQQPTKRSRRTTAAAKDEPPKPPSKSSITAELIASEASKGYLDVDEELKWYLVQCTPGFERSIERSLLSKVEYAGLLEDIVEAKVPLRRTLVYQKRAKGYVPKEEPLMGGYVMVRMRMRRNLYNFIKDTESVLGFCGYDFGARNLAGGLKAGRGFIKPKPLSQAELERIELQAGAPPLAPGPEFGVPASAAAAAAEMLAAEVGAAAAPGAGDVKAGGARSVAGPPAVEVVLGFGVGDRVIVIRGPFKNLEGTVTAITRAGQGSGGSEERQDAAGTEEGADGAAAPRTLVSVELMLMGQPTLVEVDPRALASVLEKVLE